VANFHHKAVPDIKKLNSTLFAVILMLIMKMKQVLVALFSSGIIFGALYTVGMIANVDTTGRPDPKFTVIIVLSTLAVFLWSLTKIFRKP
jgi:hypothetical protein